MIGGDVLPLGLPQPGGVVEAISRRSRIPVAAHGQVGLNPGGGSGNGLDNIPNEGGKVEVISLQGDGLFGARWNHSRHGDFDPDFDLAACGQNSRAEPGGANKVCGDVGGSVPVGGSPTRCGALGGSEQDGACDGTVILHSDGERGGTQGRHGFLPDLIRLRLQLINSVSRRGRVRGRLDQ